MPTQSKPDIQNYLTRIAEIQALIVTDSIAVTNPQQVPKDKPYWLNLAGGGAAQKVTATQYYLTFTVRFICVRGSSGAMGDFAIESSIMSDMAEVYWGFLSNLDYRNLITPTYTTIQSGFAPDSVMVSNGQRWEGDTKFGNVLGSLYTLSFNHRMFNTPISI